MPWPFRLDRTRRAGRFLEWKVGLFSVGAVLGVAGMVLEEPWMTLVAIVVLVAGMLLRFVAARGEPGAPDPAEDETGDGDDGEAR